MIISNRKVLVLAGVAVCMLVVTLALYSFTRAPSATFEKGSLLVEGLDPAGVSNIAIRADGKEVALKRSGDGFTVTQRNAYPASTKDVNELLLKLLEIRCAAKITDSPASHAELGVAGGTKGTSIRLTGNDGKELMTLLVGKDVPGRRGRYVRLAGKDTVYATEKALWVSAEPTSYIDTALTNLSTDDIVSVSVKSKDSAYTISRGKDNKAALEEVAKGKRPKASQVEKAFGSLARISCEDVAPADKAPAEWDTVYSCRLKNHTTYVAQVGKTDEQHYLAIRAEGPPPELIEKSRFISKTESTEQLEAKDAVLTAAQSAVAFNHLHSGWVYKISQWQAKDLSMPLSDLVEDIPTDGPKEIAASHILISYKGAERSDATRTKREAGKLAEAVLKKARAKGADFAALARQYSDGPSKDKGGDLGTFAKGAMDKNFEAAAWKLPPGQISDLVETPFGFHVIKRTK